MLDDNLKLDRCPHCNIDTPHLWKVTSDLPTQADNAGDKRLWRVYSCRRCGCLVMAWANPNSRQIRGVFPHNTILSIDIPEKVSYYLKQAIEATHAPAGSIMLCASAVDAMLKEKGYKEGSLYNRIENMKAANLLTDDMNNWAHKVRLDANDQRHVNENVSLPTIENAKDVIEFTRTLAEILFVLPAKITRGIRAAITEE